jgi:hypothetical protein
MKMDYMKDANGNMLSSPHAEPNAGTLEAMQLYLVSADDTAAALFDRACRLYIDMCLCNTYARAELNEHNRTETEAYKRYYLNEWYNAGRYAEVLDMLKNYSDHEKNDNTWASRVINACYPTVKEINETLKG